MELPTILTSYSKVNNTQRIKNLYKTYTCKQILELKKHVSDSVLHFGTLYKIIVS